MEDLHDRVGIYLRESLLLLADTLRFTLGQAPRWLVAVFVLLLARVALRSDICRRSWRDHLPLTFTVVAVAVALWAMYAMMVLRHPPILWPDIRLVYYWLPTQVLAVIAVAFGLRTWASGRAGRQATAAAVLLALVLGNVTALPKHRRVFESGHLGNLFGPELEMRDALQHRDDPDYFVPSYLENNPAYRTLLEYAPRRDARDD